MHEYPVTLEIVRIASEAAQKEKGHVAAINLVVGEESGFIGESIQMYFDVIAKGTLCEGQACILKACAPNSVAANAVNFFIGNLLIFPALFVVAMVCQRILGGNFMLRTWKWRYLINAYDR
jgi:Zn finger protein HypA/HybF involved in hydrogenase expression